MTAPAALPWLLEPDSPGARYLAMRDLLHLPAGDPALAAACQEAHARGPIAEVLAAMQPEGYWEKPGAGYNPKYTSSVWAVILLAQLGARVEADERVARAGRYLLDHNLRPGGMFTCTGAPSGTIDCLQGNLCWALTALGCDDPRLDAAFEWMARTVTGEGLAPAGSAEKGPRYYAYQCGPDFACGANYGQSCAWGAVKVLLAFGALPPERRTPLIERAIRRGLDFSFQVDPATARYPTPNGIPPNAAWWKPGFPVFYITDLLQLIEALAGLGHGSDPRLRGALDWLRGKQDAAGRWAQEYSYADKTWGDYGEKRAPSKWVTLRALRALERADRPAARA